MFVSCHPQVRDYLSTHNDEKFCAIFPDKSIKEEWLQRLRNRYASSNLAKDLRAYEHAHDYFDSDINRLWYECQYNVEYYHDVKIIKDINYKLEDLVNELLESEKEKIIIQLKI